MRWLQRIQKPTHARVCVLLTAAILTVGSHTISNILRTAGSLVPGQWSTYHRIFSRAKFWHWRVARILATLVIEAFCAEGPIYLAGDDTVDEHLGAKVYGKGCHRDAVRSSHKFTAYRWGHKWIVLAILVRVPWSKRPWALPVLVTLYQPEEQNQKAGRRHKTPSKLMRQMLAVLLSWFPERKFVFSGDRGYHRDSLGASSNADCQVQLREADSCPIESHARTRSKSQCEWQNHIRLHSAADHEYSGKNLRVPDWTFTFAKSGAAESAG